jgi:hypothetical protein
MSDSSDEVWPALPFTTWRETYETLHMWMQIVGKVRLALTPKINHWWNVPLYLKARGLGTGAMPYGARDIEITFDFVEHDLRIESSDGRRRAIPLIPRTVAEFYRELMAALAAIDVDVHIWTQPVEVSDPIRFENDQKHRTYEPEWANRCWRILLASERVMQEFRSRFIGKCSPVHFFWGSFDLAVTRFSGRRAPVKPGADAITREAYSHEVISHGFWPGGSWFGTVVENPVYYAYALPEPPGLRDQQIMPAAARYDPKLSEFVLNYEDVRSSPKPAEQLMQFLQSTYDAAANLAEWDRANLER